MTGRGESHHILVVDDDRRIRQLLQSYLVENGYRVTAAPALAGLGGAGAAWPST